MTTTKMQRALLTTLLSGALVTTTAYGDSQPPETVGLNVARTAEMVAAFADRGTASADAAITTKVKSAVFAEPGLKASQISVDTKDGVVVLSGMVDKPEVKERAVQIAGQVDGVRSVVDNLAIG
jgi:hyperosmotically inducible protein